MKIVHAKSSIRGKKSVFAAGNVFEGMEDAAEPTDEVMDDGDALEADEVTAENVEQDSSTIEVDNNITGHLIAECQNCSGIFISAMIVSDQSIESINGVCPLCNKDTEQTLKWIIKDYPEE